MWILGGIFAVVLAVCVAGAVLAIAAKDEDVDVNLGDDEFEIEQVEARAALVAADGALRFADPTGGNRPIIVNHVGDDPETGWVAVLAIAPGTEGCIVDWDDDDGRLRGLRGDGLPARRRGPGPVPHPGRGRHALRRPRPRARRRAGARARRRHHPRHRRGLTPNDATTGRGVGPTVVGVVPAGRAGGTTPRQPQGRGVPPKAVGGDCALLDHGSHTRRSAHRSRGNSCRNPTAIASRAVGSGRSRPGRALLVTERGGRRMTCPRRPSARHHAPVPASVSVLRPDQRARA